MKLKKQGQPVPAGGEQEMQEMTLSMDLPSHYDEPPSEDDDDDVSNGTQPSELSLFVRPCLFLSICPFLFVRLCGTFSLGATGRAIGLPSSDSATGARDER